MKTLAKILLTQLCCLPLMLTDAMARELTKEEKQERNRQNSRQSPNKATPRPQPRPTQQPNRPQANRPQPMPGKPHARPAQPAKPQTKPYTPYKPQTKPAVPAKPQTRPNLPGKPQTKPDLPDKPQTRPNLPGKPQTKPNLPDKPQTRPNLPGKPQTKPDLPGKPQTKPNLPGKPQTKPNLPGKPQTKPDKPHFRPETKPGPFPQNKPQRPAIQQPRPKPIVKPGQNTRPVRKPQFNQVNLKQNNRQTKKQWWQSNHRQVNVNNINNINNIQINQNFQNNVNWSTHRRNWGYNPWWNRPAVRPWYGGSWNCGWNRSYYHHHHYHHYWGGYRPPGYVIYDDDDNDWAQAIGWGLIGWSIGKLMYDTGYQTYYNPYRAEPVVTTTGTRITYSQPITVIAAQTAPAEEEAPKVTEISESYIASSQQFFKQREYLTALDHANKAVAAAPGDGALHEYRALVLFALGKYSEAAGVLNPVLAGGPGWDWSTMNALYDSQETYMQQLKNLQDYSRAKPDAADARFLLGYHYMVCGHLEDASAEFEAAARLQPADSVSAQLRDLTKASAEKDEAKDEAAPADDATEAAPPPPPPAPVPLEKLTGTWVADKGGQGTITLAFLDDGKFLWTYQKDDTHNEFGGDFSMNDDGLLVLDGEESQLVANVAQPQDNELKFVLAGGPPGDPGLLFVKK